MLTFYHCIEIIIGFTAITAILHQLHNSYYIKFSLWLLKFWGPKSQDKLRAGYPTLLPIFFVCIMICFFDRKGEVGFNPMLLSSDRSFLSFLTRQFWYQSSYTISALHTYLLVSMHSGLLVPVNTLETSQRTNTWPG